MSPSAPPRQLSIASTRRRPVPAQTFTFFGTLANNTSAKAAIQRRIRGFVMTLSDFQRVASRRRLSCQAISDWPDFAFRAQLDCLSGAILGWGIRSFFNS
jgi:hypothetical protein